jgi:hypothetical protein
MNHVAYVFGAAILAVATHSAYGQADQGKTREQVRAEFIAAKQAGDIHEGETGMTEREMFPWLYPADPSAGPGKTREQVRAELSAAQRAGDVRIGLEGLAPRELFPGSYPPASQTKTSGQTVAHAASRSAGN